MNNTYQRKIDILVPSKYQEILEGFLNSALETTKNFKNIKFHIIHKNLTIPENAKIVSVVDENYGGEVYNRVFLSILKTRDYDIFGLMNDDIVFSDGWLEECIEMLNNYWCVSPGYVENGDMENFKKAVEATKNENDCINLPYGALLMFRGATFRRIGLWAEGMNKGPDDLDWVWRLCAGNLPSATSKRIKVWHLHGQVRTKEKWEKERSEQTEIFYRRHGYQSYRDLFNLYKHHSYFKQFKNGQY